MNNSNYTNSTGKVHAFQDKAKGAVQTSEFVPGLNPISSILSSSPRNIPVASAIRNLNYNRAESHPSVNPSPANQLTALKDQVLYKSSSSKSPNGSSHVSGVVSSPLSVSSTPTNSNPGLHSQKPLFNHPPPLDYKQAFPPPSSIPLNSLTNGTKPQINQFTPEQDNIIMQGKMMGKTWSEIAVDAECDGPVTVLDRYNYLMVCSISSGKTQNIGPTSIPLDILRWEPEDLETLRDLLEMGERAKWKYISSELTKERNKRIPAVACQKKFQDMFGVAEASSSLGSSLCYVVSPNGWSCLSETPEKPVLSVSSSGQKAYNIHLAPGMGKPMPPGSNGPYEHQMLSNSGSDILAGNVNKKQALMLPTGKPVDESRVLQEMKDAGHQ